MTFTSGESRPSRAGSRRVRAAATLVALMCVSTPDKSPAADVDVAPSPSTTPCVMSVGLQSSALGRRASARHLPQHAGRGHRRAGRPARRRFARRAAPAHSDRTRSPAGPFNHGLDLATGGLTAALMGSDDEVAIGAIDDWLGAAARYGADVVVPRLRNAGRPPGRGPRRRAPCRREVFLYGVLRRLARRVAGPVRGLCGSPPRSPPAKTLLYLVRLWFGGARVASAGAGGRVPHPR